MGKIRVKTLGIEEVEEEEKKEAKKKAKEKKEEAEVSLESAVEAKPSQETAEAQPEEKKKAKKAKFASKKKRSEKYSAAVMQVDKDKAYPLSDALELLRKVKYTSFDETVELHINTLEQGVSGSVKLPHGTGKETRVAVADDALLEEVEKGKINFDVLISTPEMMPKLARVARVLGPRGLMPNPKNGTISDKPEELMKKFLGGQINFKTEAKAPIIHISVGKMSFEDQKLTDNISSFLSAVRKDRIRNATLKSTMSPGIKLQV